MIKTEIWKPIPGYEPFYKVSNYGNVEAIERVRVGKNGVSKKYKAKKIVPFLGKNGYYAIKLSNGKNTRHHHSIHVLVAKAFCDGYMPELEVNHKDLEKKNNQSSNLEWVTRSANLRHAVANGRMPHIGIKGGENKSSKRVINTKSGELYSTVLDAYNTTDKRISIIYFRSMLNGFKTNHTNFKHFV